MRLTLTFATLAAAARVATGAFVLPAGRLLRPALARLHASRLAQLAEMTTISIDTGDLDTIAAWAATGHVSDATTNPLFVSQAGLSGDARYVALVDKAVAYASARASGEAAVVELAMDRLAVELGLEIVPLVRGYVSTEVDIRLSFDTEASIAKARSIIAMYEAEGVPRGRILIKLAGTWEGIKAAEMLEKEGITCNITLVFGFIQAVAAAQAGARLISPFPGRIRDWHMAASGNAVGYPDASEDPGVTTVAEIYAYYKRHGHGTICMPASWRPSSTGSPLESEIVALAGTDSMTIPPPLLAALDASDAVLDRQLEPAAAAPLGRDEVAGGCIGEAAYRLAFNADSCATTKMAEGINAFIAETDKLERAIRARVCE